MRLIDADRLLQGYEDHDFIDTHIVWNAPTVDAVPVMHGEWLDRNGGYQFGTCSVCGDRWGSISVMKYCPSCGARMDGEKERRMKEYIVNDITGEYEDKDYPELIRCKDCHWHYGTICRRNNTMFWNDNDFCGYAEREEE